MEADKQKAQITLRLEPENKEQLVDRPKTVLQLLNRLKLRHTSCLVIHEAQDGSGTRTLLTPDVRIYPGQKVTVRKVTSSG